MVENLRLSVRASASRGEPLDHFLFAGPPGLGKTTIAHVVAAEMGVPITVTSGPAIDHKGILASLLTNMEDRAILFIDEIHRLQKVVEEALYPAMEDRVFDMAIGDGAHARVIRMDLPRFTLLAATTRPDIVAQPLRSRFGYVWTMDYYDDGDLAEIVRATARRKNVSLSDEAASLLARRSRGTPRIANRLFRRVLDFAEGSIPTRDPGDADTVSMALLALGVDEEGLDRLDRRYLSVVQSGGCVGISAIAAAMGESTDTVAGVVEPFLLLRGFVKRTPRGRVLTRAARRHMTAESRGR